MDTVIERISEIESAASSIMDNANERKKAFAAELEERTAAFDGQLEKETEERIKKLQAALEITVNQRLDQLRSDSAEALASMEKHYEEYHTQLAEDLFHIMIKE